MRKTPYLDAEEIFLGALTMTNMIPSSIVGSDLYFRIGIDVAGSDLSQKEMIQSIFEIALTHERISFHIYASSEGMLENEVEECTLLYTSFLQKYPYSRLQLHFSLQTISMTDSPSYAIRRKKNSSLHTALLDLKKKNIDALISCGNTGAIVLASTIHLGRASPVARPALAIEFPVRERAYPLIFLDVGATVDSNAKDIISFAMLGAAYSVATQKENAAFLPRVALLNMGIEPTKGIKSIQYIHTLFAHNKERLPFIFAGNVEPQEIFSHNPPDVVVCNGFTGNIFLKTCEALVKTAHIETSLNHYFGKKRSLCQAALLLGAHGPVYKCHGKATKESLQTAIMQVYDSVYTNCIVAKIQTHIASSQPSWLFLLHALLQQ